MKVPLLNIVEMHQPFQAELEQKVLEVLRSGSYINGRYVEAFEEELAAHVGVKHAVGVTSGSDALIIAMMALGVKPGDEVLTTPFTFFATVGAISRLGATPVFVDIDPETFNIQVAQVEEKITDKTVGIIPVSLFGQTANMDELVTLTRRRKIWMIEDAAQSIGARYDDRMSGSFPDMGTFSFFPAKNLGGVGDGGAVTTNSDQWAEKLRCLRNHGGHHRYFHDEVGGNFRLDALQAAVLSVKLPHLNTWEKARQETASYYDRIVEGHPQLSAPVRDPRATHVFNQYVIRVMDGQRDAYKQKLDRAGIANAIYYPLCLHQQNCFAYLGHNTGDFPHAERAAAEVLALPIMTRHGEQVMNALTK